MQIKVLDLAQKPNERVAQLGRRVPLAMSRELSLLVLTYMPVLLGTYNVRLVNDALVGDFIVNAEPAVRRVRAMPALVLENVEHVQRLLAVRRIPANWQGQYLNKCKGRRVENVNAVHDGCRLERKQCGGKQLGEVGTWALNKQPYKNILQS